MDISTLLFLQNNNLVGDGRRNIVCDLWSGSYPSIKKAVVVFTSFINQKPTFRSVLDHFQGHNKLVKHVNT